MCQESWEPLSDRIIKACFYSVCRKQSCRYMHQSMMHEEAKDDFYDQLQKVTDSVPKHCILIIMADWNPKVKESRETNWKRSPEMCQE